MALEHGYLTTFLTNLALLKPPYFRPHPWVRATRRLKHQFQRAFAFYHFPLQPPVPAFARFI